MQSLIRPLLAGSLVLMGVANAAAADADIVGTAVKAGSFKTLAAALDAAGLIETLKGDGPFTVFAPTDEAFAKLPEGTVATLLKPENKAQLTAVLTYHVVSGRVLAADVVKLNGARTVNGQRVDIKAGSGGVTVDGAKVVTTDIACSNGVIHVIDRVILPESKTIPAVAAGAGTFQTLLAAAKAAGLVEALSGKGPLTVFAPTDEAFKKLPAGAVESLLKPENKSKLARVLTYHVVPGRVYSEDVVKLQSAKTLDGASVKISTKDGVRVNESNVVATDIDASNGVIHVIDTVLMPPLKRADARQKLEQAVASGAQLYNSGHHSRCAQVYMSVMQELMSERIAGLNDHDYATMKTTLTSAKHQHDASRRAWTLRHGIDKMHTRLSKSH